jgi:hypothetical protein
MNTLAMISILALLTIGGAAVSDALLAADQQIAQGVDQAPYVKALCLLGDDRCFRWTSF